MTHDNSGIMLVDLRRAEGGSPTFYPWQLQGHDGYGLAFAHVGDAAPPARLPSPVRGWHRVFLGFQGACALRVRLAGHEPWFRRVETSVTWRADTTSGEELFWCDADLTDAIFEFLPRRCSIALIDAIPGWPICGFSPCRMVSRRRNTRRQPARQAP